MELELDLELDLGHSDSKLDLEVGGKAVSVIAYLRSSTTSCLARSDGMNSCTRQALDDLESE